MPKQAILQNSNGQRATVAAFMLLLLAAVTGLAFAATLRPAVNVSVAGLAVSLPADWRPLNGDPATWNRTRAVLKNERRPALRTVVQLVHVVDQQGEISRDTAGLLRAWFPLMTMAPPPEDETFDLLQVGNLEAAFWTGVLRSRLPVFGQAPLSVVALSLVTDGQGRYWAVTMRDDNYRHEDPAMRVVDHRERFVEVLETLRRDPDSDLTMNLNTDLNPVLEATP
ncbi:MAG: hypothetical protein AAGE65_06945 [Planctomycetota bacterium]